MLFITSNEDKFKEAQSILDVDLQRKDIELEEIQAVEIENVIQQKLKQAYEVLDKPLIAEDTGIFIQTWNRLPGALTKFFLERLGNEKICEMLGAERRASAETYVGYKDGDTKKVFKGIAKGKISRKPRGDGFGWDPIFVPEGYEKTFGEMSKKVKNKVSMRKKALKKLANWL